MKKSEIREILKKLDNIQITLEVLKELDAANTQMKNIMIMELQIEQGKLINHLWKLI